MEKTLAGRFDKKRFFRLVNSKRNAWQNLLEIALGDDQPQCWRAAWVLNHCTDKDDPRLATAADRLIQALPDKEEGHQRELLKILLKTNLNEDQEGVLYDQCMRIWENPLAIPSLRIKAIEFCLKLAVDFPELLHEIRLACKGELLDALSPGIRKSLLKKIEKAEKQKG